LAGISARTFEAAAPHMPAPSIFADHFDVPSPTGSNGRLSVRGHGFARALPAACLYGRPRFSWTWSLLH